MVKGTCLLPAEVAAQSPRSLGFEDPRTTARLALLYPCTHRNQYTHMQQYNDSMMML